VEEPKPGLNAQIAQVINRVVTSMWFFWFCLGVVIVVRGPLHNNKALQELLLGYENDFQLLLIACLGFAGALQTALLFQVLGKMEKLLEREGEELEELCEAAGYTDTPAPEEANALLSVGHIDPANLPRKW
jgi:hypothetical protein